MSKARWMVIALVLAILFSCQSESQEDLPPDDDPDPLPPAAIIIDHTCTDLAKVPASWIEQARSLLRIGYGHTSHGSQPVSGMMAFRGESGSAFYFSYSDWGLQPGVFLNDYWGNDGGADDLGAGGDLGWRSATIAMLSRSGNDRNVVVWSWCGGVSENSESGINAYLNAMAGLEKDYPAVTFVYMTGHLDGTGTSGNLHRRNEQIRAYVRANKKILFDFADIESYDPDGQFFADKHANDNCDYDSDANGTLDRNWASDWQAAHPGEWYDCSAAHSQPLNGNLKAYAAWWLWTRIAGWDGK